MKVLVTGVAGFIGSHLAERLLHDGHEVIGIDNLQTGQRINNESILKSSRFNFVEGSILNISELEECIIGTDYIFHLAAAVGVFNIVNNPLNSLITNVKGTENVLELANKYSIPILFSSSSEIYGKNVSDAISENDDRILGSPTTLRWSYSEAKAIDESLVHAFHLEHGLETRIVRFFNTVGPRQIGSYGMVLPRFVNAAIEGDPIYVYGSGNQTRCFAHILDVINAVIKVAFSENTIGKAINIGNNKEISMNDLAGLIINKTNSKSKIIHIPYDDAYGLGFEDMQRRVPNIDLIKSLVGWVPERNLEAIIDDIVIDIKRRFISQ